MEQTPERFLVFDPIAPDAKLIARVIEKCGATAVVCGELRQLLGLLREDVCGVLLGPETLREAAPLLAAELRRQPSWSDFSLILLTSPSDADVIEELETMDNITLLEYPFREMTLASVVRGAIRARKRQYQVRELLAERETATEALAKQALDLERSNQDLEQYAYAVSHDLQEPLRMILSFVQLLSRKYKGKLDTEGEEYVRHVETGVQRMHSLIVDLLAYSRLLSAKEQTFAPVDLSGIVAWAVMNCKKAIDESGATIKPSNLPTVLGRPETLAQVFQNLIDNAIKYRRPGAAPLVEISSEQRGQEWVIAVRDNGMGFSMEYAERIFGLFKRLHGREYPGSGLGLSICKRIIEQHGGRIWAESQENRGSTFFISLPAVAEVADQPRAATMSSRS